jgi:hypothetical protein
MTLLLLAAVAVLAFAAAFALGLVLKPSRESVADARPAPEISTPAARPRIAALAPRPALPDLRRAPTPTPAPSPQPAATPAGDGAQPAGGGTSSAFALGWGHHYSGALHRWRCQRHRTALGRNRQRSAALRSRWWRGGGGGGATAPAGGGGGG